MMAGCRRAPAQCAIRCHSEDREAAVVAHVAAHELGAAAYTIEAVRAAPDGKGESAGRLECRWQRDQLPDAIRELVLDDQRMRNEICWSLFEC